MLNLATKPLTGALHSSLNISWIAQRSVGSLVLVEHKGGAVSASTHNTLTAATSVHKNVTALAVGTGAAKAAAAAATFPGVEKVLFSEHAALAHQLPEPLSALIVKLQSKFSFTHIWAPASTFGKDLLPRAAALLDVQPVSDIVRVVDADTYVRPIYAGNALATVRYSSPGTRLISVRPSAFPAPKQAGSGGGGGGV
eukprot:CAMPEP_0202890938 /NCGR_PEP_ID=MMETSP1392-20130828/1178_1 /ASSEMBLY_ACC=CAM_ASM_000868 /TAXON_ID=225041 /ORGANISM="Chlamydomonas chlamydogama, Strain SAG 11-48b" /LENGTH=196 /DNA_ID=CAMNT_0049574593 /DNA_START=141 /DNA_END=728 /DNA_ORIENTATION=+